MKESPFELISSEEMELHHEHLWSMLDSVVSIVSTNMKKGDTIGFTISDGKHFTLTLDDG